MTSLDSAAIPRKNFERSRGTNNVEKNRTSDAPGPFRKWSTACRVALVWGLVAFANPLSTAKAAPATWDFNSIVQTPYSGNSSLRGTFTLDPATSTISSFDFITPVGNITSAEFTASAQLFTPALNPNTNFVDLFIADGAGDVITLFFETSLAAFSGNTFFTRNVQISPNANEGSQFDCGGPGFGSVCSNVNYETTFVSGAAIEALPSAPAPEPASLALAGLGLIAFGVLRRGHYAAQKRCRGKGFHGATTVGAGVVSAGENQISIHTLDAAGRRKPVFHARHNFGGWRNLCLLANQ